MHTITVMSTQISLEGSSNKIELLFKCQIEYYELKTLFKIEEIQHRNIH